MYEYQTNLRPCLRQTKIETFQSFLDLEEKMAASYFTGPNLIKRLGAYLGS